MQTIDDHLTFLLPRPIWVNDIDVSHCNTCALAFGHLRRRHHCRHCGNIYCHDCSSRKVPLPQLGYGNRPVRVCNDCFEVAYLVTYAIDEDHGLSTQIHGARGLLELTEKEGDKDLHNMVAHGGIDALIWLCRTSTNTEIHHLLTTNLAMLAEKESIRPVIITKWALPPLLQLLRYYMHGQQNVNGTNPKKPPTASITSASPSSTGTHSSSSESTTRQLSIEDIDYYTIHLEIIINCTHVIYQLAKAGILSQEEIITDGVLETLFSLTIYKMDNPINPTTNNDKPPLTEKQNDQGMIGIGPDYQDQWKERESVIQSLAAKSISFISSTVSNQASVIEQLRNSNQLTLAIGSENYEVKKYIAKTVAYLSLRNDKYKPVLLGNGKVRSLLSLLVLLPQTDSDFEDSSDLRQSDITYYLSPNNTSEDERNMVVSVSKSDQAPYTSAVSHICCALANFATNQESQVILMDQPRLLRYICNVPSLFPTHLETHRHVARCLANLALYEENNSKMLALTSIPNGKHQGNQQETQNDDVYNIIPTLLTMGQSANATKDLRRHIIRAIDNLSTYAIDGINQNKKVRFWKSHYQDIKPLIEGIMTLTDEEDTLKRAKSILSRFEQYFSPNGDDSDEHVNGDTDGSDKQQADDSITNGRKNNNGDDDDEIHQDDSTETEHQDNGPPKGKSNKKNKKKKKNM